MLIAAVWGASTLLPTDLDAEASEVIPAQESIVFAHVNDLRRIPVWSPMFDAASGAKVEQQPTTMGEGAYFKWTDGVNGGGVYTIIESEANKKIVTNIKYDNGQEAQETWTFTPVNSGNAIKVNWKLESKAGSTPWAKVQNLGYEEKTEAMMKTGLKRMKDACDQITGSKSYATAAVTGGTGKIGRFDIQEIDFPGRSFVAARKTLNFREMEGHFATFYPRIYQDLQLAKLELDGYPSGLYYNWDETSGKVDVAAAFPVKNAKDLDDEVKAINLPAGKALMIEYVGPMDKISEAHLAMNEYISQKGYTQRQPVIEEYVSNQGREVDPQKMVTKLYFLLE